MITFFSMQLESLINIILLSIYHNKLFISIAFNSGNTRRVLGMLSIDNGVEEFFEAYSVSL